MTPLFTDTVLQLWTFLQTKATPFTEPENLHRLVYIGSIFVCAWVLAMGVHFIVNRYFDRAIKDLHHAEKAYLLFQPVLLPLIALIFLGTGQFIVAQQGITSPWFELAVKLTTAWVVLSLLSNLINNKALGRLIATTIWIIVAADLLDVLDATLAFMDSMALPMGASQISLLDIIQGIATVSLLLWIAILISRFLEYYLTHVIQLKDIARVLIMKVAKVVLMTIAFLATLTIIGIDLSALAVFGGALGVGLGFGLQKVVSNYISGIIILTDKSIKPGDVIEVGEAYGHIAYLGARYISVVTPDGREHLIPNEEFITTKVINWSYSNDLVSQRLPIGVSYNADIEKAMQICVDCAKEVSRVLDTPPPSCMLQNFGASSVDLLLLFWIKDPKNGILNIKSDILRKVWQRFHEEGIEIPFPQMDVHLKSMPDAAKPVKAAPKPATKRKTKA